MQTSIKRKMGKRALSTVLTKQTNVNLLEKYIYNTANEEDYLCLLYECVYIISMSKDKKECIKDLITNIFNGSYLWTNFIYMNFMEKMNEKDQFLTNPFEIEEGVLECNCGSKRTISFQRQTRSADEGSTTFVHCVECDAKWRHNN